MIFLPGGPGQLSMEESLGIDKIVPESWGLVLTDPRGVGCNFNGKTVYPREFYQTQHIAHDVLSVIKDLKRPHSEIVLFGVSYGTVVATEVSHLAEKLGLELILLFITLEVSLIIASVKAKELSGLLARPVPAKQLRGESQLKVLDTSALIDGRIADLLRPSASRIIARLSRSAFI